MIEFRRLTKRFGDRTVLEDIDLVIPTGTVQFVIGPSGAGKSVLMKHVVGLVRADAGEVRVDDEDVTHYSEAEFYGVRRKCGFVFQQATLLDGLSVRDNVALAVRYRFGVSRAEARARADTELTRLDLAAWAHKFPADLGAGLKKRAAIARAVALEPQYLIYDEPTTGLDPVAARRVDRLIAALKGRVTQIVVSHDLASILGVADRIAMLHNARVHLEGTPAELRASDDAVIRQFLGGLPDGPM
jgi:phospholipid/cholesterol/gamma-HCH transport system ATP-binding protein